MGFCTNCGSSVNEGAYACSKCGANPRVHHKFCPTCGVAVNPEQIICVKCSTNLEFATADNNVSSKSDANTDIKLMEKRYRSFIRNTVLGIILAALGIFLAINEIDIFALFFLAAGIVSICASVSILMLIYKMWEQIPKSIAKTTPGKAVGFLFIPFFNLYWIFIALRGLALCINEALQKKGCQESISIGFVTTTLVFCLISAFLTATPAGILDIVTFFLVLRMYRLLKNGAVKLASLRTK